MTGSVVRFCHPTLQVSVLENESCALRQRVEQGGSTRCRSIMSFMAETWPVRLQEGLHAQPVPPLAPPACAKKGGSTRCRTARFPATAREC